MWAILAVLLIADIMDLLDATITNIAAPTIVRELGGGELLVKWLGSSYALSMGILLVLGGRLGDRFGQRRLFLVGIAGFTLASLACGLSVSPAMLVVARLCQGGFGALLIPQGIAIMTAHFSRDMMRKAFSVFGPAMALAMVAGPLVAGFLIDADIGGLSWRPMFLINIALGAIGFVAAFRVLPRDAGDRRVVLDGLGAGLLGLGMFGLLFGLIEGSTEGWAALSFASIAVGVAGFALFALRQKTVEQPLIKPSLFADRGFTSGLVMGLAFFGVVGGMTYVVALFLQLGLGLTPSRAALALDAMVLGVHGGLGGSGPAHGEARPHAHLHRPAGHRRGRGLAARGRAPQGHRRRPLDAGTGAARHGLRHGDLFRHALRHHSGRYLG